MDRDAPYQGLDSFAEEDADFFFGRTRDIRLIVANVFASPLTVLYGPSGVGKTSVLRAGVLPRLRERDISFTVLREWSGDATGALRDAAGAAAPGEGGKAGRRAVLVLDEFEDFFLDPTEDDAFAAELARLLTLPGRQWSALVAIREDSLAKLDRFEGRIPGLLDNVLRLDQLDREAGREAILGPKDRWNALAGPVERFELEDELVEAVLDSVPAGNGRVETALLQLVLRRLWTAKAGPGPFVLRRATLDELGGLAGIVREHVQGALDALSPDRQEAAAAILEHLVTPSRLRIAQRTSDLAAFAGVQEEALVPLLEELSEDRILRPVAGLEGGDSRYEVQHGSLADAVLDWRTRYVTQREVEAERRRFRRKLALAVFASLLLAVVAAIATYAWTQRQTARAEALSAEARGLLATDPAAALEKALEAVDARSVSAAENALRATFSRSLQRRVIAGTDGTTVEKVDIARDGTLLTIDTQGLVTVRTATGETVGALSGLPFANDAVFCPDPRRIAVAVENGAVLVAGDRRVRLGRDPAGAQAISCSADGSRIATVSETGVRVFSRSGKLVAGLGGHESAPPEGAAISPDGTLVAIVDLDGARVVRIGAARPVATLSAEVASVAFSPDGSRIAAGGTDGDVRIWTFRDASGPLVLDGHERFVSDVEWSADGRLVVSASTDRTARVWDAASGDAVAVLRGHTRAVRSAAFAGDGRIVATASDDGTARLWETPVIAVLAGHTGEVTEVAVTPDGTRVVTASKDGTVRVWNALTGRRLVLIRARTVSALALSADGRRVVTVHSNDGRARTWNVARPRKPVVLPAPGVTNAAFAPDGTTIAIAGAKGTISFFDLSGSTVRRFRAPAGLEEIGPLSFAPGGERIVVAEIPEGVVVVLDAVTGAEVARLTEPVLRAVHARVQQRRRAGRHGRIRRHREGVGCTERRAAAAGARGPRRRRPHRFVQPRLRSRRHRG